MKKIFLILFVFISSLMFGQDTTKTSKTSADADIFQRLIQNIDSTGITKFGLIVGTDTTWMVWNGNSLNFEGDVSYDSAIMIGNSTSSASGMIKWNGTNFYGYTGTYWKRLNNVFTDSTSFIHYGNDVAIGVDTVRYEFNVKGTTHSDRFRGVTNDYQALVTFSVDDGSTSDYTVLKPLFTAKGVNGIINITTNQIGGGGGKMTWDQVREMQAAGWEVGSHSITHAHMTTISADSVRVEMRDSKAALEAQSLTDINNWTFPGNQHDAISRDICREYYRSGSVGGALDTFNNPRVLRSYQLSRVSYTDDSRLALLKRMVDDAYDNEEWMMVYIHAVVTADSVAIADLIDYIQAKGSGISIVTLNEALDIIGNNYDHSDGFAVNGDDMRINGTIYRDGAAYTYPFIHTYYDTSESCNAGNLFMGKYSGNQTNSPSGAGANYACYNTAYGTYTLEGLTTGFGNTAIGAYALDSNTTGYSNTALGYQSLINNTVGINNTAIGYQAEQSGSLSDYNVAVGNFALRYNTGATSDYNTAIGYVSMMGSDGNSATTYNTALGANTLQSITTGNYNTAIGGYAGNTTTTQSENIFFGYKAGRLNTGLKNITIGVESGEATTTSNNVHIGYKAAESDDGGGYCVNIGYYAGRDAGGANGVRIGRSAGEADDAIGNILIGYNAGTGALGNYNVAIGYEAGKALTSTGNALLGYLAGTKITSGANNTMLGYRAGANALVTGSGNVFIGYLAGYNETGSNLFYLDNSTTETPLYWGDFANDTARINGILDVTSELFLNKAFKMYMATNNAVFMNTVQDGDISFNVNYGGVTTEVLFFDGATSNTIVQKNLIVNGTLNYAADAQADDDYEIDIPDISALHTGLTVTFSVNTANTDGATLEITSIGDLDAILKMHDQTLVTGDIEAGQIVVCTFDGTNWQMTSQLAQ